MVKTVIILYIVCFFCYVLFSRVPDYFDGDFTKGIVSKAIFSAQDKHPVVVVNYKVGGEKFTYTTGAWFLSSYKPGQMVPIIYNSSRPKIACIYTFVGYWVKWHELLYTAIIFVILFIVAVTITGKNNANPAGAEAQNQKRK